MFVFLLQKTGQSPETRVNVILIQNRLISTENLNCTNYTKVHLSIDSPVHTLAHNRAHTSRPSSFLLHRLRVIKTYVFPRHLQQESSKGRVEEGRTR